MKYSYSREFMINNIAIANNVSTKIEEIAFIDAGVENYQVLAAGIKAGIDIAVLKSDRSGIEQIASVLTKKQYSTVHIVSHGSPGCLYLGNSQLSLDTLQQYRSELKTWFSPTCVQAPCPQSSPLWL